ncbi:hypothetical protein MKW98_003768 [Papaver atlanticum]|uniref:F-box domain-containing protein n=1 Tax=Papaver atlanticum TaxID=357466 RepID=A0AAD4T5N8_9MAGN|nr:hypothetical protein MKW98_003768 [Papaver atlanticum]
MELENHKRKKTRENLSPTFSSRPTSTRTIINQYFTSDIVCHILSYLDQFDLIRCSTVCKSWHDTIHSSHLLTLQYWKRKVDALGLSSVVGTVSESTVNKYLEEIAMKQHNLCLQNESVIVNQWNGCHSVGIDQFRMKMGLVLSGLEDKVMRIWSLDSFKCLEEYSVPKLELADFDFDESKIVGLVGTRICIWRRHSGKRSMSQEHAGTAVRGFCMRYIDPEAVVGCGDGTARVFDMYSRNCSRIIKMHNGPITCMALTDDELVVSGSSLGSIRVADLSSDQVAGTLRSAGPAGIKSLCYNPGSYSVFAGSTSGHAYCWDLRTMKPLWEKKIIVGGIDGVLRILNQGTGEITSSYVMDKNGMFMGRASSSSSSSSSNNNRGAFIEKMVARKLSGDVTTDIDRIPKDLRPPITCLAVGMKKVVTTHNNKFIRLWRFQ